MSTLRGELKQDMLAAELSAKEAVAEAAAARNAARQASSEALAATARAASAAASARNEGSFLLEEVSRRAFSSTPGWSLLIHPLPVAHDSLYSSTPYVPNISHETTVGDAV